LQKLLNQGDVSQRDYDSVLKAAQVYFKAALNYVLEKFPITNDTLLHAKWIDVGKRADAKWESVEHFIYKFTSLFSDINVDDLYDEFCDYKTLTDEDIGRDAWNEAKVVDGYGSQEQNRQQILPQTRWNAFELTCNEITLPQDDYTMF